MSHIFPHWTWPDRVGQVIPVHVYSLAHEAELFPNGRSQGLLRKEPYTYRFRWDHIVYELGELHIITYKNNDVWATDTVKTVGAASKLQLAADPTTIKGDGVDLSFITLTVTDSEGRISPNAGNTISFSVSDNGETVATDNGDTTEITVFPSKIRKAFIGHALVIVRTKPGTTDEFTVTASAPGFQGASVTIKAG